MERRTEAVWDAAVYGGSALVALVLPLTIAAPLDRRWGVLALPGYAAGAVVAAVMARRRSSLRDRALLAVAVAIAVAVLPLLLHADARLHASREPVKSDVLVVEAAAAFLLEGRDPYGARFDGGLLASWPESTRTHFPYLPTTLAFGLPRAAFGPSVWTDPRVVALLVTLAVVVPALAVARASGEGRLRTFQVLVVLASGAPLIFTSGKELPILALLLGSLVALDRDRAVVGGVAAGLAASAHQLAWAVLPFVAVASWPRRPPPPRRSAVVAAGLVIVGLVTPFVAWDPGAFIEDAVRFPLGAGQEASGTPLTPGSMLAASFPDAGQWLVAMMVVALVTLTVLLGHRVRVRGGSAGDVAAAAGTLLLVALLLAPRVRVAYFAFPLNLFVWSRLVLGRSDRRSAAPRAPSRDRDARRRETQGHRGQEPTAPHRVGERIRLAGQPDMEDQDDREEADVAARGRTEDAAARALMSVGSSVASGGRASPRDDHHRHEHGVGGDQRWEDGLEHGRSAPEEEAPTADEEVPAEPEPESEQQVPPRGGRHERPEEVGERGPLRAAEESDALPDQERPDDHQPADDRDRSHGVHTTPRR